VARDPQDVNLWEIITALDNQTVLVDCVDDPEACERSEDCLTRSIWVLLSSRLQEFWQSYTLADLLKTMRESGDLDLQQLSDIKKP